MPTFQNITLPAVQIVNSLSCCFFLWIIEILLSSTRGVNFYFYIDGTFYQPDGSNSLVRPVGQISSPQERGNPQLSGTWESHKPEAACCSLWKKRIFPRFLKLTDFLLILTKLFVETDNFFYQCSSLKIDTKKLIFCSVLLVSTFLFTLAITCRRVVGVRVLNTSWLSLLCWQHCWLRRSKNAFFYFLVFFCGWW